MYNCEAIHDDSPEIVLIWLSPYLFYFWRLFMSEQEKKFLEIFDLRKSFGTGEARQDVLRGMNFTVSKGEFCVLLGPSGSGKSTLLNIIGGIDTPDSGYVSINGY